MANPTANTFEARKEKFNLIQEQLGDDPRSEANADRLLTYIQNGALPYRSNYSPAEEHENGRLHRNYFLQIFFNVGTSIIDEDMSQAEAREKLEDAQDATMPNNLPSDGSKGQWRSANKHKQKAYEWFLCEWDGDQ